MQYCSEIGGSAQIWCYFHCYKCCHMQVSCFKLTKLIKSKIKTKKILKHISWILKGRSYVNNLLLPQTRIYSCNIKVPILKFYFCLYPIPCVEVQMISHNWYYQNDTRHSYKYICIQGGGTKVMPFFLETIITIMKFTCIMVQSSHVSWYSLHMYHGTAFTCIMVQPSHIMVQSSRV